MVRAARFGEYPDRWIPLVLGAVAVAAYGICELLLKPAPLRAQDDVDQVGRASSQRFASALFARFAVCEPVFLLGVALAFVAESYWPVLIGAVLAVPLLWWEAWPGPSTRRRFAAALERGGHRSSLT